MAWLGAAFGGICGGDGAVGEGWHCWYRFEHGCGDSDDRDPGVHLGDRDSGLRSIMHWRISAGRSQRHNPAPIPRSELTVR